MSSLAGFVQRTVLDLTRVRPGPACGGQLAD